MQPRLLHDEEIKVPDVTQRQITISNNTFYGDTSRMMLKITDERDLVKALNESYDAVIYCSPALVTVRGATILTGKHVDRWNRVVRWFDMYDRFMSRLFGKRSKWFGRRYDY